MSALVVAVSLIAVACTGNGSQAGAGKGQVVARVGTAEITDAEIAELAADPAFRSYVRD